MKNYLFLNSLRGIKKAPGRFIAIMMIIFISCAFYSGVKAAAPDLKNSAWKYYDDQALADVHIMSDIGFNDDDIDVLMESDYFDKGYAGYSAYLLTEGKQGMSAIKVLSYSSDYPLNKLYILEGAVPGNSGECIADIKIREIFGLDIGDTISLTAPGDDETEDYINTDSFTITGFAQSPLYVTESRGSTTIGNGSVSAYMYIPEEDFAYETYTDIYLSVSGASSAEAFSDEYMEIVSKAEYFAETVASERLEMRKDSIRTDADEELADARAELSDAEEKYNDGYAEYKDALTEYNRSFSEITDKKKELADGKADYEEAVVLTDETEIRLKALQETISPVDELLKTYEKSYEKVLTNETHEKIKEIQAVYDENTVEASISDLLAVYIITNPDKDPVTKTTAKETISALNKQVAGAADAALIEIEEQKKLLEETAKTLDESEEILKEYEDELKKGKHELDDAEAELDDAEKKISDAKAEIADAEAELDELLFGSKWYILNRDEFEPGCYSYGMDADRVDSIAAVFPIFFILIAALVCSSTMSRMVEEQRTENGTLKALGFSSGKIVMQYVIFACAASVIGSAAGTALGFAVIPGIVFRCYTTLYNYPVFESPFMPAFALVCMIVAILCTGISAIYTAVSELSDVPAQLIRPKPPRSGKRIFLEKIGFIWKRMKFNSKVTFRNLFRYKRRFFMMVAGIGGCTALLLTAFGLKESIRCIADRQYAEISVYDAYAVINDDADEAETDEAEKVLENNENIVSYTYIIQDKTKASEEGKKSDCYLFVPMDDSVMDEYVVLRNRKSGTALKMYDTGVVITEKLSGLLGVSEGDYITIDGCSEKFMITGIAENYTYHYIYMTKALYEQSFGTASGNMILFNTGGTPEKSMREKITSEIVACDGILTASFMYDGAEPFRNLVSSLDMIVALVIVFSAALAIVILLNLANININERMRELATIKVLGFFDGEVGAYVYRENIVSSITGIITGLVAGIFLERFVIKYAEADEIMFSPDIPWFCFINAVVMIIVFIVAVNIILHFKLKKIDMASSMKAIE